MRILGVDYGDSRVGLAVSDEMRVLASPLPPLQTGSMRKTIDEVAKIARETGAAVIVVGLPLNMNGTEGPQAGKVRAFGSKLGEVSGAEIVYKDERLTTVQAHRAFDQAGVSKSRRSRLVDSVSAQIILQSYLDAAGRA